MGIQVDLFSVDLSTHLAKIPKATGVAVMEELNGDGNTSFTVARGTVGGTAVLDAAEAIVVVSLDGERVGYGVLDVDSDDASDKARDARALTVTAPGTITLLNDAVVWPIDPTFLTAQRSFTEVSPGELMALMLNEAQFRGALDGITWTFTDTHDSGGMAWPQSYTRAIDVGYSLRALLGDLANQGLVDFRMNGLELSMYVANTELDGDTDVVIEPSWLTTAPRQRSRAGKVTHMMGLGDLVPNPDGDGTYTRAHYLATSAVAGRRRESLTQFGGVTDIGTVTNATTASLLAAQEARQAFTTTYLLVGNRPRPWDDYNIGDNIGRRDVPAPTGDGLEQLRVRSMSVELEDSGATAVTLELNDVLLEFDLWNARRIDALTGGGMGVVGGSVDFGADLTAPAAPAGVGLTSDVYLENGGTHSAVVSAFWLPVTTNYDGSLTFDIVGYEAQWRVASANDGVLVPGDHYSETISRTPTTSVTRSALPLGIEVQARVRTVDRSGNSSTWTESDVEVTEHDTTPPAQPSAPSVTSTLGVVRVVYDGKNNVGGTIDLDTARIEVHRDEDSGFVPVAGDPATRVGTIRPTGGTFLWGDGTYDVTYTWRFLAVDWSENASPPSVAVQNEIKPLVDVSNFPDDAMEELYARTGHFITLTADNFQANLIEGDWLKVGALEAQLFTGIQVRTAASGPRVELNSLDDSAKVQLISAGPHGSLTDPAGFYSNYASVGSAAQDYVFIASSVNTTEPANGPAYVAVGHQELSGAVEYRVDLQGEAVYVYGPTGFSSQSTQMEVFGDLYATEFHGAGSVPIGVILPFLGFIIPSGWLLCNGSTFLQATYPDLYSQIGGSGGVGTLPDMRGRVPVGAGTFTGLYGNDGLSESSRSLDHIHGGIAAANGSHSHHINTQADHDHSISAASMGTASNTTTGGGADRLTTGSTHNHSGSTGDAGGHAHGGDTGSDGNHAHLLTSVTSETVPYYGLYFIIRAR